MPFPRFHIAIDSPAGSYFSSFASDAINDGDPDRIKLTNIRNKCAISEKLFFTVDGKSRIGDGTELSYYMSLTGEGQSILRFVKGIKDEPLPGGNEGEHRKPSIGKPNGEANQPNDGANQPKPGEPEQPKVNADPPVPPPAPAPEATPGVRTFSIKVIDSSRAASQPLALPAANEGLAKLIESIGSGGINRGTLPTFADKALASLAANYAANPGSGNFPEPAELTEKQWEAVFNNNRVLHGYWYDSKRDILLKASKKAFKLRGAAPVGEPPVPKATSSASAVGANGLDTGTAIDKTNEEKSQPKRQVSLPPIPPFYIHDKASVNVTEIRSQFQHTLTKEGFNSIAVGGSLGGGPATLPVSISASFDREHAETKQDLTQTDVNSLVATYSFPRVVVELDYDDLELTDDCKRDASKVTDSKSKDRFFRQYGTVFVTSLILGGFLHSTRNVTSVEKSSLNQIKDKTRIAAGISIQTPKASGSLNFAKVDSKGEEQGTASLYQDVRLTWDAYGGDTLLCSNPPAWASTVKDYRLWRLMSQERLVSLAHFIKDIDPVVYQRLEDPRPGGGLGSGDITKDPEALNNARIILIRAFAEPENNRIAKDVEQYYETGRFDKAANIEVYNAFTRGAFLSDVDTLIKAETQFAQLGLDQKVGFGLFMISEKVLSIG